MMKALSVSEFARRAGITKKYAFDLAQSGRLGATKDVRGHWVISADALDAYVRARKARQKATETLTALGAAAAAN
jgi:excisionase family DNA binding protein